MCIYKYHDGARKASDSDSTALRVFALISKEYMQGHLKKTTHAVPNTLFVYITTPEIRTPHYGLKVV